MSKKNLLSSRDRELQELAENYEAACENNQSFYADADDFADLADWYAVHNKVQQANEVVEYGLNLHPGNTALLVEQAYLLMDSHNKDKAQEVIDQISDNYSPEVKVLKANLMLNEGKIDDAEQLLDTIEDKEDLANIVDVAYMYLDMGYPEKALEWLNRGLDKYAENEAFTAVTADCFYAQGLTEKAAIFYNKLIDKDPYSASYWLGLARCYFDQQMFDKAIEACDYAIVADEEFADAYMMRGHAFYQLGNEESAYENYTLAEKHHALSSDFLHMFMGLSKLATNQWEEAYSHLEQALEIQEEDSSIMPSLYAHTALCLFKLGKKRKASQYFKKAHELGPEEVDPYLLEGRAFMENGDYEKAVKKWAKALKIAPYADTWNEIGMYSMEMGQLSYAKLAFERVKEMEPGFEKINERLASLYVLLRDKENFMKYNQLCKHPLDQEELKKIEKVLEGEDKDELAKMMKNIISAIQ